MTAAKFHIQSRKECADRSVCEWIDSHGGRMPDPDLEAEIRRSEEIRFEIRHDMFRWHKLLANSPDELIEWVSRQLAARGFTAASKDVSVYTLHEYAQWVAREYLQTTGFGISAELRGDAEADYWRSIAIAANTRRIDS
jgi:hypothetical protein